MDPLTTALSVLLTCGQVDPSAYKEMSKLINLAPSNTVDLGMLFKDPLYYPNMMVSCLWTMRESNAMQIIGFTNGARFGNISILAVGDLYCIQQVRQNHVFNLPRDDQVARLHGSLWKYIFDSK